MSSDGRVGEYVDEVNLDDLQEIIENGDDRDIRFWRLLYTEGKESFDRGISTIQKSQDTAIELMKFDLLLGSIYVALHQFGSNPLVNSGILEYHLVPFGFLTISLTLFFLIYSKLGSHTLSSSSENAHKTLDEEYDEKEYLEVMSIVYFAWSDDNIELHQSSGRYLQAGIVAMFASLGAYSGIFIFF